MLNQPISAFYDLEPVDLVEVWVQEPDLRLLDLLAKPTPLTAGEWAYLEAIEAAAL